MSAKMAKPRAAVVSTQPQMSPEEMEEFSDLLSKPPAYHPPASKAKTTSTTTKSTSSSTQAPADASQETEKAPRKSKKKKSEPEPDGSE